MRTDLFIWILIALGGAGLGVFFFGGLWWTTRKGMTSKQPGMLFLGSMLLRTAVIMAGFYFLSNGQWQRIAACLLGFTLARFMVLHYTKKEHFVSSPAKKEQP